MPTKIGEAIWSVKSAMVNAILWIMSRLWPPRIAIKPLSYCVKSWQTPTAMGFFTVVNAGVFRYKPPIKNLSTGNHAMSDIVIQGPPLVRDEPPNNPGNPAKASIIRRQLHWLRELREHTGNTLSEIALTAGVSLTTLAKLGRGKRQLALSSLTVDRIRTAFNVPGPDELADRPMATFAEASRIDAPIRIDENPRWRINSDVLKLAGYMPGDVLIVAATDKFTPRAGDVVMVQTPRGVTFRIYDPPFLVPASPSLMHKPLLMGNGARVIGVVVQAVRNRPPIAALD